MRRALAWARLSAQRGEVPIGAVVVCDGKLLGGAHDGKELFHDPTAHAEILAIREATQKVGDWRLDGASLYVTLEPCPMCAGAILQSRIKTLIYGAANMRWGACSLDLNLLENVKFNHRVETVGGVLEQECANLLRETFRGYRIKKKQEQE